MDAARVMAVLSHTLNGSLRGVYLYGSCAASALQHQSDLDFLVLVNGPISGTTRLTLVAELLKISGWHAVDAQSRPLDVTVVRASELILWQYPPTCELLFGEWLRDELASQRVAPPEARPDLAIQITTVNQASRALFGPPARWAMARSPAPVAAILDLTRSAYLGERCDQWSKLGGQVDAAVQHLMARIAGLPSNR